MQSEVYPFPSLNLVRWARISTVVGCFCVTSDRKQLRGDSGEVLPFSSNCIQLTRQPRIKGQRQSHYIIQICVLFLLASLPRCLDHQIDQLMIQVNLKPPARRLKHSEGSVSLEVCRYPIMYCIPYTVYPSRVQANSEGLEMIYFIICSFLTCFRFHIGLVSVHLTPIPSADSWLRKRKKQQKKQFWSLVARPRAVSSATKTRCLGDSV